MIVLLYSEGQLCNQLLAIASAYTLGIEYKESVICPVVEKSVLDYFKLENKTDISIKFYGCGVLRLGSKFIHKISSILYINSSKYKIGKKGVQIFTSWNFKDDIVFAKHQEAVRAFFEIKDEIVNIAKAKIIKETDKINIGVHVRRGDYKEFQNGRWYYSNNEYIKWMLSLSDDKKIHFYVSSNENIDIEIFRRNGLNVSFLNGSAIEDLCCLSLCDMIMGPPSTFSWWAAMYGNKPRLILESRDGSYSWSDFMYLNERVRRGGDKY